MKQTLHSFSIDSEEIIDEIQVKLTELTHEATGAQVIHLAGDDSENVFNLCFQTLPNSSNGVAHILEHCVLCGSEKFPARDPFFSMHRRSLATFMNAMTGSDFTCYPAASTIEKDFYHLLEVYLDAVFFRSFPFSAFPRRVIGLILKKKMQKSLFMMGWFIMK